MNSNQEDLDIIDKILLGDKSLYAKLVGKYQDYAYTIAYRILQQEQDAQEATQDAFIKAFSALKNFNNKAKFSTWLYRIIFNTAITYNRKQKSKGNTVEIAEHMSLDVTKDTLEYEDKKKYIALALEQLLPIDATLITLFYIKEQSLEEIGEITGIKTNAVKVKLFRARKRLATALNDILSVEASTL